MQFFGRISEINYDAGSGYHEIVISSRLGPGQLEQLWHIREHELRITAARNRKQRSLSANAYAWVLMGEMAQVLETSKEEVYQQMLYRYAPYAQDERGYVVFEFQEELPGCGPEDLDFHWKYLESQNGTRHYILMKGISEYDVAEMSAFVGRIVEEARELEIDTGRDWDGQGYAQAVREHEKGN